MMLGEQDTFYLNGQRHRLSACNAWRKCQGLYGGTQTLPFQYPTGEAEGEMQPYYSSKFL
jgi:hypothetical protein